MLLFTRTRRHVESVANSSNQTSINQRDLNELTINVPPLKEQARILEVLSAEEERDARERQALRKLRMIKAALANDLLSGRVRVTNVLDVGAV